VNYINYYYYYNYYKQPFFKFKTVCNYC